METLKLANLALRFVLELCLLAALGFWGYRLGQGRLMQIGLAVVFPSLAALVWARFISPKAPVTVPTRVAPAAAGTFGLAIAGLATNNHPILAGTFSGLVLTNGLLLYFWHQ